MFRRVALYTTKLEEMRRFYESGLGFRIVSSDERSFALEAGSSILEFRAGVSFTPLYHYALSIPENKIEEALAWTQERIPVATGIYDFDFWNAHAFYFLDPEGNIGELIARHSLPNATSKPFDIGLIENVNELGVVTSDVAAVGRVLGEKFGLKPFPDPNAEPGGEFQALGNAEGMFIVVKSGRTWLGSDRSATAFPAEVTLGFSGESFELEDTLLRVNY